ncbi:hypothetical protein FDI76_gp024 [Serratia phage vB_Sru_IME250]|uniref:Uncharacterized protein n=1 Tax=Serratia phage vB_Sru_IME250 TaxID=1852640 RepID=A0A1J0MG49_9CAUD|nr:hypothetical protein FDI76_gp024 [Serratia phage vB_Sru_IME250]ANM47133.1 hypothetical protein [Serratia phage vB_Sru_IME250]APD20041.1 hypothetical protein [Serratia phage vB_Sru_IME250]
MLHNNFMADLRRAVEQVCHTEKDTINLDSAQTIEFFKARRAWRDYDVQVISHEGEMVKLDLPSFPLPTKTETQEQYELEGIRIIPKFGYHSIVYFFLSRMGANIIPTGMRI